MKRFLWFTRRSMRSELSLYILFLSLISAFGFLVALDNYFIGGLDMASRATMQMEVRSYDKKYQEDPDTPLINTHHMKFYLDNLENVPSLYKQLFSENDIQEDQFYEYEWTPNGIDEWKDSRYFIVYKHILYDGRTLYVVTDFEANLLTKEEQDHFDAYFERIFYFIGAFLLLMLAVVWFYNRRINQHTQNLATWAEKITLENIQQQRPDFRYSELNSIAEELQKSYERNAEFIAREHQFLRHSSHELRTPIATIRSNIEFLQRIGVPETMNNAVQRISRSSHTMLQLTETLLWLCRESETAPSIRQVDLRDTTDELIDDLSYLLQGKPVSVHKNIEKTLPPMELPETPFRIVFSNLLRNAFQYTADGNITIDISKNQLRLVNSNQEPTHQNPDDSFGLGLMLVEKICDRLHWDIAIVFKSDGVEAILKLPEKH